MIDLDHADASEPSKNRFEAVLSRVRNALPGRESRETKLLERSPLFDAEWYAHTYRCEMEACGIGPVLHYLRFGAFQNLNPHPLFDSRGYRKRYPEVDRGRWNPLVHYLVKGWWSGCRPNRLFHTKWYIDTYQEGGGSQMDPLSHYLERGRAEGCLPNPLFDEVWYEEAYGERLGPGELPLAHYLSSGFQEGCDPNPFIDTQWYRETYPDIRKAGLDPFAHYLDFGAWEGRHPNPVFDGFWYERTYLRRQTGSPDALKHFWREGFAQGLDPGPCFNLKNFEARGDAPREQSARIRGLREWWKGKEGRQRGLYRHFPVPWVRLERAPPFLDELPPALLILFVRSARVSRRCVSIISKMPPTLAVHVVLASDVAPDMWGPLSQQPGRCRVRVSPVNGARMEDPMLYLLENVKDVGAFSTIGIFSDLPSQMKEHFSIRWRAHLRINHFGRESVVAGVLNEFENDPELEMVFPKYDQGLPEWPMPGFVDVANGLAPLEIEMPPFHMAQPPFGLNVWMRAQLFQKWLDDLRAVVGAKPDSRLTASLAAGVSEWVLSQGANIAQSEVNVSSWDLSGIPEENVRFSDIEQPFEHWVSPERVSPGLSICVHLHLFHLSLADEFIEALRHIRHPHTLLISTVEGEDPEHWHRYFRAALGGLPDVKVRVTPNRGRDVAPWVIFFSEEIQRHDIFVHLHTKKSPHKQLLSDLAGVSWRRFLVHHTMGSIGMVDRVLRLFRDDPAVGLIIPPYYSGLGAQPDWGENQSICEDLFQRMTGKRFEGECPHFPAGSFFWIRTSLLQPLFNLDLALDDFDPEKGQLDGTLAHAIERIIGVLPALGGQRTVGVRCDWDRLLSHIEDWEMCPSETWKADLQKVADSILPQWNPDFE